MGYKLNCRCGMEGIKSSKLEPHMKECQKFQSQYASLLFAFDNILVQDSEKVEDWENTIAVLEYMMKKCQKMMGDKDLVESFFNDKAVIMKAKKQYKEQASACAEDVRENFDLLHDEVAVKRYLKVKLAGALENPMLEYEKQCGACL